MADLEQMLSNATSDRKQSLEDQLRPIHDNMDKLFDGLDIERNSRVQKEREILDLLREKSNQVEEAIEIEKEGRQDR